MSSEPEKSNAIAVVGVEAAPDGAALRAYLAARPPLGATWFAPRDLNDLEDAIEAGRFSRVLFSEPADFLESVWNGEISTQRWRAAGVQLQFATSWPQDGGAALIWRLVERYEAWRAARRRAAIMSCLVLSAIAIAAAFGLIWAAG